MKYTFGLALILMVVFGGLIALVMRCESNLNQTMDRIGNTFATALKVKPEIRVNETVVYNQTTAIAEFAVVSKEQLVDYVYLQNKQLMGQTIPLTNKKITARAKYLIKAGFDLHEPFIVNIDQHSDKIEAEMPHAKILSIEGIGSIQMTDEAGAFNPTTDEERQDVLNGLDASARRAAESSGLVDDAEKQALERLQEIARKNNTVIQFRWRQVALP